jgi:hypothetical protein
MQSACAISYGHLWPVRLRNIFTHFVNSVTIFGKQLLNLLIVSATFVRNISHSTKNSATIYHKCAQIFVCCTGYSGQILMALEFFRQIFKALISNIMKIRPV